MMMSIPFLAALMATSTNTVGVSPEGANPRRVVNYAPAACILSRARSGSSGGVAIETRPFEDYHDVIFLLPKVGGRPIAKLGSLSVRDSMLHNDRTVSVQEPNGVADRTVRTTISDDQLALAAKLQRLGVMIPNTLDEHVSLAGIGKALHAIEICNQGLLSKWGAAKTWSVDPVPNFDPRATFLADDYPEKMRDSHQQGFVRSLIRLDSNGQVVDCRPIESSGQKEFEDVVCNVIRKRVKFTPAIDPAGNKVPSYYLSPSVKFQLAG